jgi:hypothetical protein
MPRVRRAGYSDPLSGPDDPLGPPSDLARRP